MSWQLARARFDCREYPYRVRDVSAAPGDGAATNDARVPARYILLSFDLIISLVISNVPDGTRSTTCGHDRDTLLAVNWCTCFRHKRPTHHSPCGFINVFRLRFESGVFISRLYRPIHHTAPVNSVRY